MSPKKFLRLLFCAITIVVVWPMSESEAASCVWKVTSPSGGVLYLGGSVHALQSSDYPLPASYNRALAASSKLVFESDPKTIEASGKGLVLAGKYPKGDQLKNHVDPRTYDYLRRFFALRNIPEAKFNSLRPWLIDVLLEAPAAENTQLGVEGYLKERALAAHKPIIGLESVQEHIAAFVGLNDRQSEALLLILFINAGRANPAGQNLLKSWRAGDADALEAYMRGEFQEFPAFVDRILSARNRRWIPKLESFLQSGQTYFVVVGAGHMGGREGVLSLLRSRGYSVEQL